jgi:hypothetical protein
MQQYGRQDEKTANQVSIIKTCAVCVVCICQRVREYEFISSCVGSLLARVCIGDLAAADLAESSTAWLVVKMVRPRCSQGRIGSRSSVERAARERAHVSTGRSLEKLVELCRHGL